MIHSLFSFFLAAFGLGVLVFIHELGHYFMARKVGMRVEAFAIGFGKPLYTWEHKGVKWHLCWLPFGGYVRIAGMERKGHLEQEEVEGGFFSKTPTDRIKVALAGPCMNIILALLVFTVIWMAGGRSKPFSEFTHRIGALDPRSSLYQEGIRPGDEITSCNGRAFQGFKDLLYASILKEKGVTLTGYRIDYWQRKKTPFSSQVELYPVSQEKEAFFTTGLSSPASYLFYVQNPEIEELFSPSIRHSGLQYGDRILWVDGKLVFSLPDLSAAVNDSRALLTIRRAGKIFLQKVARLQGSDLKLSPAQKADLDDWRHEAGLAAKVPQLFLLPYLVNYQCRVEHLLSPLLEKTTVQEENPLQLQDEILAVDGVKVSSAPQLLSLLQKRHITLIVQRGMGESLGSWKEADTHFEKNLPIEDLQALITQVGREEISSSGSLHLLKPVLPEPYPSQKAGPSPLFLGIALQDGRVDYNPLPTTLFLQALGESWRTVKALVTGSLHPKWMTGPIGIVEVMHQGWMVGVQEALFWLGLISLNLGVFNLLPIPVLDGGHICFSLLEKITRKRLSAKAMEKLVIPVVFLLVAFFIYITYQDISRLVHKWF